MLDNIGSLEQAVAVIRDGGIAIFPTDTAFAIGCRIDNEHAVEELFTIKQRLATQAVPILVNGIPMAKEYVTTIPPKAEELMKQYWPGALTIILPANTARVSAMISGMGSTVGLRQPNNDKTLEIIRQVGVPLIGTSANFHGQPTPYALDMIEPEFAAKADIVLPGICRIGVVSTVVDVTKEPWQIVRPGAIEIPIT